MQPIPGDHLRHRVRLVPQALVSPTPHCNCATSAAVTAGVDVRVSGFANVDAIAASTSRAASACPRFRG